MKQSPKKLTLLSEFKEFINRGNVIDLAVGVIIGGAFGKIVSSLVTDLITPLVGIILGGINVTHLAITVPSLFGEPSSIRITYGVFLQNILDFLIVALCVFLFLRFWNRLQKKAKKAADAESAKSSKKDPAKEQVELLREILASLKKSKK